MAANNETGAVQPVAETSKIVHESGGLFHTDAIQAAGRINLDMASLGVDMLTLSAHKIGGPKGVGALVLGNGASVQPLIKGGGQERRRRAGTENVPGIVGFATAAQAVNRGLAAENARVRELAAALDAGLPGVTAHGAGAPRVPHVRSYGFAGVKAEPLLHALEARGVMVSAGAACNARAGEKRSGVLAAINAPPDLGTLRFSFSRESTLADVEAALAALPLALASLR
jgi:cysteine desulfurase